MTLQIGQVLNRRYRIDSLLGQGGFGAVYKAWDLSLERACAVKENLDTSEVARRQFTREATVLASLSHPNLPRVTDHFIIPGLGQYLVMDFVDGLDLGQLVRNEGPIAPERALNIIKQVADALEYMHALKPPVLHRDIKPGNIKITPEGRAVLVDFGLVKMFGPQLETTIGARAVTPGYSPPEQYGQGTTDSRTDIYALGATLYTLLTARLPPESVQRYNTDNLVLPHQVDSNISPVVSAAVGRAMALNPLQRYQTIAEMRAVLWPAVTVRSPQSDQRSGNWVWIVVVGVVILVCLAVAGTLTLGSALALPLLFGSDTPRPSQPPTSGPVLFHDDFSSTSNGWEIGADSGSRRLFDQNQYVIQVTKPNWEAWSNASGTDLTNLHAEVTISSTGFAADEGFGIVCDYTDATHYYFLGITPDGYYAIAKKADDTETILSDPNGKWAPSMQYAQNAGSYRVGADCGADGRLSLTVGGSAVAAVNDTSYSSGQIGLFVRTFDKAPAEVRFDDMIVTSLP
jgi:serine/threonine protein kinase